MAELRDEIGRLRGDIAALREALVRARAAPIHLKQQSIVKVGDGIISVLERQTDYMMRLIDILEDHIHG